MTNQPPDGQQPDLESTLERLEQLDPAKLIEMSPEDIQEALGGAKLGDMMAQFQQQAAAMADAMGVDLNSFDEVDDHATVDDDEIHASLLKRTQDPVGSLDEIPGARELWEQARQLPDDERLQISIEIKSPPVTDIEKVYYSECHYRLLFDPSDSKATYRDVNTPRQDYLSDSGWPAMLLLPLKTWPDLEPLWDTVKVEQYNLREALQTNDYKLTSREDLMEVAERALRTAFT